MATIIDIISTDCITEITKYLSYNDCKALIHTHNFFKMCKMFITHCSINKNEMYPLILLSVVW